MRIAVDFFLIYSKSPAFRHIEVLYIGHILHGVYGKSTANCINVHGLGFTARKIYAAVRFAVDQPWINLRRIACVKSDFMYSWVGVPHLNP